MSDKPKHDVSGIDLSALAAMKDRGKTPEQQARYDLITERQRRMQEYGLKQPKSGTWGKP